MRNLNDIFKTNNRKAQRAILDKFDISKEDKNKTLNSLANTNGGGSVSKYAPRYFKIDFSKADALWKRILGIHNDDEEYARVSEVIYTVGALYKIKDGNFTVIQGYPFININTNDREHSFSYMPLYLQKEFAEAFSITTNLLTFEDMLENIGKILAYSSIIDSPRVLSMDGLTEITEEEFYKID